MMPVSAVEQRWIFIASTFVSSRSSTPPVPRSIARRTYHHFVARGGGRAALFPRLSRAAARSACIFLALHL